MPRTSSSRSTTPRSADRADRRERCASTTQLGVSHDLRVGSRSPAPPERIQELRPPDRLRDSAWGVSPLRDGHAGADRSSSIPYARRVTELLGGFSLTDRRASSIRCRRRRSCASGPSRPACDGDGRAPRCSASRSSTGAACARSRPQRRRGGRRHRVVIACGAWSPRIAAMAGAEDPADADDPPDGRGRPDRRASPNPQALIEWPIVRDMDNGDVRAPEVGPACTSAPTPTVRSRWCPPEEIPSHRRRLRLSPTEMPFTEAGLRAAAGRSPTRLMPGDPRGPHGRPRTTRSTACCR